MPTCTYRYMGISSEILVGAFFGHRVSVIPLITRICIERGLRQVMVLVD